MLQIVHLEMQTGVYFSLMLDCIGTENGLMDCSANQQSYENGSELFLMGEQVAGVSCNTQLVSLTTSSGKSKVIVDKTGKCCYAMYYSLVPSLALADGLVHTVHTSVYNLFIQDQVKDQACMLICNSYMYLAK